MNPNHYNPIDNWKLEILLDFSTTHSTYSFTPPSYSSVFPIPSISNTSDNSHNSHNSHNTISIQPYDILENINPINMEQHEQPEEEFQDAPEANNRNLTQALTGLGDIIRRLNLHNNHAGQEFFHDYRLQELEFQYQ